MTEFEKKVNAANRGDADAQLYVGLCYHVGQGVAQNYEKSVEWYKRSADSGNASAQNCLGICYASGQGVPADKEKAKFWWQKAAANGDKNAKDYLKKYFNL